MFNWVNFTILKKLLFWFLIESLIGMSHSLLSTIEASNEWVIPNDASREVNHSSDRMNAHNQVRRAVRHLPWFRISHIRDLPWRGNSRNMADAEYGKSGTMGDLTLPKISLDQCKLFLVILLNMPLVVRDRDSVLQAYILCFGIKEPWLANSRRSSSTRWKLYNLQKKILSCNQSLIFITFLRSL